jgi:pimeloyl-ACP methyl ester carboxylesterase
MEFAMRSHRIRGAQGVWVTLVHGGLALSVTWDDQAARLSRVARVLTFDLRGFGESAWVGGEYGVAALARDLLGLHDALGIRRSIVVGFSLGMVALEAALQAPGHVAALMLVGTAARMTEAASARFLARARANFRSAVSMRTSQNTSSARSRRPSAPPTGGSSSRTGSWSSATTRRRWRRSSVRWRHSTAWTTRTPSAARSPSCAARRTPPSHRSPVARWPRPVQAAAS